MLAQQNAQTAQAGAGAIRDAAQAQALMSENQGNEAAALLGGGL